MWNPRTAFRAQSTTVPIHRQKALILPKFDLMGAPPQIRPCKQSRFSHRQYHPQALLPGLGNLVAIYEMFKLRSFQWTRRQDTFLPKNLLFKNWQIIQSISLYKPSFTKMFSQRHFPKGDFSSISKAAICQVAISQMYNFPNNNFLKVRLGILTRRRLQG